MSDLLARARTYVRDLNSYVSDELPHDEIQRRNDTIELITELVDAVEFANRAAVAAYDGNALIAQAEWRRDHAEDKLADVRLVLADAGIRGDDGELRDELRRVFDAD